MSRHLSTASVSTAWPAGGLNSSREALAIDGVGFVLKAVDLHRRIQDRLGGLRHVRDEVDRFRERLAGLEDHVGELERVGVLSLNPKERHPLARGLDHVEHVVEARDEIVDVPSVERGDPRLVKTLQRVVSDGVCVVLELLDLVGERLTVGRALEELQELARALDAKLRMFGERVEEIAVACAGPEHGAHRTPVVRLLEGAPPIRYMPDTLRSWRRCRCPCARRKRTRPRTATAASRRHARASSDATAEALGVAGLRVAPVRTGPLRKKR